MLLTSCVTLGKILNLSEHGQMGVSSFVDSEELKKLEEVSFTHLEGLYSDLSSTSSLLPSFPPSSSLPPFFLSCSSSPLPTISSTTLWCGYYLSFQEEAFEAQRGGVTGPATPSQVFWLRIQTLVS